MTKIRTAEEVLKDWITSPEGGWEPSDHEAVIKAMCEHTKQYLDLVAEDIKNDINETLRQVNWAPDCEYKEGVKKATNFALQIVDESILKLKERVV